MPLTEDTGRELMALGPVQQPLKDDAVLFDGAIVCHDANGELVRGANTAGLTFAGIYRGAKLDNTDDGELAIIDPFAPYRAKGTGFSQASLGARVYISDDDTVALSTTNAVFAGEVLMVISATEVWVLPPAYCKPPLTLAELDITAAEVADLAEVAADDVTTQVADGAIVALTFTPAGPTAAECEALRDKCEDLAEDIIALNTAAEADRAALEELQTVVQAVIDALKDGFGLLADPA